MLEAIISGIVGSGLYRARGVDEVTILSRSFERWLIAFLVSFMILFSTYSFSILWFTLLLVGIVGSYLGVATGHGSYYHLWYAKDIVNEDSLEVQKEDNEKMRPLVKLLTLNKFNPIEWQYKSVGLALTGLAMTIVPGGAYIYLSGETLTGTLLALSGLIKLPMYALGHVVRNSGFKAQLGTQWGEWFYGFALFFILGFNL